jgi:acylphosphatase
MKKVRKHLFISGIVQGVGFRYNARNEARRLGVTGWIRNLWDGRVEAVIEGDKESV